MSFGTNAVVVTRFYCIINPFYTDTRYNDKISYNDNLTGTKHAQEGWQLIKKKKKVQQDCI